MIPPEIGLNPILFAIVNFFWTTGIAGKIAAAKFIGVFKKGLDETKWTDEQKALGVLSM